MIARTVENIDEHIPEMKIVGLYMIFGLTWIILSDQFLIHTLQGEQLITKFQSYKGTLFIAFSGLLLYSLIIRENRKLRNIQRTNKELETGLRKIMSETEERERNRIASELHDGIQQKLAGAALFLNRLKEGKRNDPNDLNTLESILNESIEEIREISHNMNSSLLKDLGLTGIVKRFKKRLALNGFQLHCEVSPRVEKLPYMIKVNLYRIVQELISNSIKHSNGSEVNIILKQQDDTFCFDYRDSGTVKTFASHNDGNGLTNIRNRIRNIEGMLLNNPLRDNFRVRFSFAPSGNKGFA